MAPFDIAEVRELTMYDEMDLQSLGDRKTALFIIIDDKISSFNFLASIMYAQLFKELCDKADKFYRDKGNRLPVHVRCLIDEFANIGQIPDFEKIISIIRSREISVGVIVQNPAQIKSIYGDNAKTIEGNCDSILYLGSGEQEVNKYISDMLGKTTIDHKGTSTQKGVNGSYSVSDQIVGRELMTPDEVGILPNDECILRIRGVRPFRSKKFKLEKHKRYDDIADSGKTKLFDLKSYLDYRRKKYAEKESKAPDLDGDKDFEELSMETEYEETETEAS
ncbi:MAG: TraM recognition domain-containing protein [Clostridiales bacterium]|nr:TraM recognition domain-containing protein [Clostridiales bacterium]